MRQRVNCKLCNSIRQTPILFNSHHSQLNLHWFIRPSAQRHVCCISSFMFSDLREEGCMETYTQLLLQLMCSIKHPLKPIWDASSLAFIVPQMGVRMGVGENTFIECLGMMPKIKWRILVYQRDSIKIQLRTLDYNNK